MCAIFIPVWVYMMASCFWFDYYREISFLPCWLAMCLLWVWCTWFHRVRGLLPAVVCSTPARILRLNDFVCQTIEFLTYRNWPEKLRKGAEKSCWRVVYNSSLDIHLTSTFIVRASSRKQSQTTMEKGARNTATRTWKRLMKNSNQYPRPASIWRMS